MKLFKTGSIVKAALLLISRAVILNEGNISLYYDIIFLQ